MEIIWIIYKINFIWEMEIILIIYKINFIFIFINFINFIFIKKIKRKPSLNTLVLPYKKKNTLRQPPINPIFDTAFMKSSGVPIDW